MKIKSLLAGMLASAAFVACTNDVETVENGAIQAGEKGYVAVNLFNSSSSRAADTFEAGTFAESAVSKAVFLFLDGNYNGCANPYTLEGDDIRKIEWNSVGVREDQTTKGTVLVIDGIKGEVPAYIVAVLNPTADMKFDASTSLANLKDIVANYSSVSTNMVMSNAVYAAANGKEVVATPITLENIAKTKKALENKDYKPVTIQVERVVAKVTVDNLTEAIAELNSEGLDETIDDQEDLKLNFVLTGWEVLQNNQSRLIKNIDATNWTITNWNAEALKRSYWANDYRTEGRTTYEVTALSGKDGESKYVEETVNQTPTAQSALNSVSPYLLVSGYFADAEGEAVSLVEWRGQKYTAEGYLNLIAGMEKVSQYYYIKETVNGVNKYESFKADFLEMKDNTANDWGATAELTSDAPTFYTVTFKADGKTVDTATEVSVETVKEAIAEFGQVQYWNGGNTYYFVPIKHQAAEDGNFYGVVRNHVYKMTISKISGYGTPVANPNQAIDEPEKPTEGDTYMEADVVILDWRVVENNVELE